MANAMEDLEPYYYRLTDDRQQFENGMTITVELHQNFLQHFFSVAYRNLDDQFINNQAEQYLGIPVYVRDLQSRRRYIFWYEAHRRDDLSFRRYFNSYGWRSFCQYRNLQKFDYIEFSKQPNYILGVRVLTPDEFTKSTGLFDIAISRKGPTSSTGKFDQAEACRDSEGEASGTASGNLNVVVRTHSLHINASDGEMIVSNDSLTINDYVADTEAIQLVIFQLMGAPLVENCLAGFNNSAFAYGQAGSGKAYTMWVPSNDLLGDYLINEQQGLTSRSRVFERLFAWIIESMSDGLSMSDGSEKEKLTGAAGECLEEAGNINRSLSQLGNLINILAKVSHTGKQWLIPYRDSRLTFLLQESLGGNAKLSMICDKSQIALSIMSGNNARSSTDHLVVSLHRGLEIIDNQQESSAFRKSAFWLSIIPVELNSILPIEKVGVGITTLPDSIDMPGINYLCSNSKKSLHGYVKEANDRFNLQLLPVERSVIAEQPKKQVPKAVEKFLAGASETEMALEDFCSRQNYEIAQYPHCEP